MTRRRFSFCLAAAAIFACGLDVAGIEPSPVGPIVPDASFEANLPPTSGFDANAACADTNADPLNCGECGHSCGTAICANATCVPELLLTGMNDPFAVAVKDGVAFVAEHTGGRIFRTDVDAGAPVAPQPLFNTGKAPRAIDLSSDRLFWVEQTMVRSILFDGGSPDGTDLGNTGTAIVVLSENIVFTDFMGGRVIRRSQAFGDFKELGNDAPSPFGIAVDQNFIYWTSSVPNGAIKRFSRVAPGAEEEFLTGEDRPASVAVGPTNLFWTTPAAIRFAPLDRSAPAANLFDQRNGPTSIVKDGPYLYWLEPAKGWVVRGRNDGSGQPLVIASGETQSDDLALNNGIAVDDRFVYWVSTTNGTLKRTVK